MCVYTQNLNTGNYTHIHIRKGEGREMSANKKKALRYHKRAYGRAVRNGGALAAIGHAAIIYAINNNLPYPAKPSRIIK